MLPKGWQQRHSSSHNRPYYFNELTGVTQWDLPATSTTDDPAPSRGNKVHAYHLLVKHAQSRRPSSWREAVITISETEALEQIRRIRSEIFAASSGDIFTEFKARAQERSDCSSAKKGGDLGFFGPGEMQSKPHSIYYKCNVMYYLLYFLNF